MINENSMKINKYLEDFGCVRKNPAHARLASEQIGKRAKND